MDSRRLRKFASKYHRAKPAECWIWHAARHAFGYGKFWDGSMSQYAHRFMWMLKRGPIPNGLLVLHHCDNPPCVNPDHLFVGTHKDNIQDMDRKGRANRPVLKGEAHGRATVTVLQVKTIRRLYERGVHIGQLCRMTGKTRNTIAKIVHRRTWAHVQG